MFKASLAALGFLVTLASATSANAQYYIVTYQPVIQQPVLKQAVTASAPAARVSKSRFDYRSLQRLKHRSNTKCYKWDRKVRQVANPEADRYKNLYRTRHSTGRLQDRSLPNCR